MPDNFTIANNFSLLAKLIEIHGENSFKAKSYASAAFSIEKLPVQLSGLPTEQIYALKGIGASTGKKIVEQLETGRLEELNAYIIKTPLGLLEMMKIKGLGPKKIATIWKNLEIETIGELLYACNENRLLLYKGFGQKTQQNIKESIEFYLNNQGSYLYSQIEAYALAFTKKLEDDLGFTFLITGDFRRHAEVIHKLEWVSDIDEATLLDYFGRLEYSVETGEEFVLAKGQENVALHFFCTAPKQMFEKLFLTTGSPVFIEAWKAFCPATVAITYQSEDEIFRQQNCIVVPPFLRETASVITQSQVGLCLR